MTFEQEQQPLDFDSIRLRLASPEQIKKWSFGEVTKPETINYRTQKPEKEGLFDEKIFGPVKDWECYCGKYKRIRYKGVICDKCGVEVTRAIVRRERFGHISLAAPVSHIWFLRGVPSKVGLFLDMSVQDLEKVVYFANFIVTRINEDLRTQTLEQINEELKSKKKEIEHDAERELNGDGGVKPEKQSAVFARRDERLRELSEAFQVAKKELTELSVLQTLSESQYHDLALKYGHIFEASIGAEALHQILSEIDLNQLEKLLQDGAKESQGAKQKRLVRRLKLVRSFIKQQLRPEWMVITTVPVIPPDLRPMVQLDGGRFAASDLNDLYRRVINRNNRLKRLLELNAPEVICRNEKRMLQEAVDALIDNSARHGKTVTASTGQKRTLKSLADILKGKQGRFRQNLLGKRVDYSGRSVIVVGPHLELHQCGLPKTMALELFKPFVISKLIQREYVHNVRSANRFIETGRSEVWDILEEVTSTAHVLLNRAPTLHRLGIVAFQPLLIEGKAIQIHPMVCPGFNADFDGDQMAVHVPLTDEARREASEIMLASKNLLKPSSGEPVVMPSQDLVLGSYYLTMIDPEPSTLKSYPSESLAVIAYQNKMIRIHEPIMVVVDGQRLTTTVGRIIFNSILPTKLRFVNAIMEKGALQKLITRSMDEYETQETAQLLDRLKNLALSYVTQSGISWGMWDLPDIPEKEAMLETAQAEVDGITGLFEQGLLTDDERKMKSIEVWAKVKEDITKLCKKAIDPEGPAYALIDSKARGTWTQMGQMIGMKGLVTNPQGETIELPVKSSFKQGFTALEFFIASHGTRKGLADTALRTANAGYLTRRLIDVAQSLIISEHDCGDTVGMIISRANSEELGETFVQRLKGLVAIEGVRVEGKKTAIVEAGEMITEKTALAIDQAGVESVRVRSVLTCKTMRGLCQTCYGLDLAVNKPVSMGVAVGIIAAQSIGEPGTQLTLRTFHAGGVAGVADVTTGLPRVEELFEARPVKSPAIISPIQGVAKIVSAPDAEKTKTRTLQIHGMEQFKEGFAISEGDLDSVAVKSGQKVEKGEVLLETNQKKIHAPFAGTVDLVRSTNAGWDIVVVEEHPAVKEFTIPHGVTLLVKEDDEVGVGDQLTEGSVNLQDLFALKGKSAVEWYVIKEVLKVYFSQGIKLSEKHVQIIVRQMFSRVMVEDSGDSDLLEGDMVERAEAEEAGSEMASQKKRPVLYRDLMLGIQKASLSTSSFLSAASFQETQRVLVDAAVTGKVDKLRGLKENVIIGRLIPAGTGYQAHVEPVVEE